MRVLVTGSRGKIGAVVAGRIAEAGFDVVEFDLALGHDIRDAGAVQTAAAGCDAAVHLAAIPHDHADPIEVLHTNAMGTWHMLDAARRGRLERVVVFSSVNALGVFLDRRPPDYLPIDDAHPSYPRRPYGLSKRVAEQMCEAFTADTGIATVCLRPPAVLADGDYEPMREYLDSGPEAESLPAWEYGAFLDVSDAAEAALLALTCTDPGHATVLLCADDVAATRPGRELAQRLLPDVEWRGGTEYDDDPYRALVDTAGARRLLGWHPNVRWRPDRAV